MSLPVWLNELAELTNGFYDEENNLLIDPGDGVGANSYAASELVLLYRSNLSPREAADIIRMGGMP
jgi:hypothetical protein